MTNDIMKIEYTDYGKKITIPDYGKNSEFEYKIRNVKVLNKNYVQHPLIDHLVKKEDKIFRKLITRLKEMERIFIKLPNDCNAIKSFEQKKNVDFNEYFHEAIDMFIEQIDNISLKYAVFASNNGYSYSY